MTVLCPVQGISVFQDLIKEPGALLCFDTAGLQMAVCIFIFSAVEFDEEGNDGIMARFFINQPACQAVPIILGIIMPPQYHGTR